MNSNNTVTTAHSCPLLASMRSPRGNIPLISIQVLIGIGVTPALFTIMANVALLFTFVKTQSLHKPAYCLLAALCSCDFLTGAITQPALLILLYKIQSFQEPSTVISAVSKWSGTIFHGMSFIIVFYIAVDKYVAICHPFFYQSHATIKRYMVLVAMAWIYKIVVSTTSGSAYLVVYGSATSLSMLIIFFSYIRIHHVIAQKRRFVLRLGRIGDEKNEALRRNREERGKTNTILILLAIITVSYVPPLVVLFVVLKPGQRTNLCKASPFTYALFVWSMFACNLSSAINPIIYCIRIEPIRVGLTNLIFRQSRRVRTTQG